MYIIASIDFYVALDIYTVAYCFKHVCMPVCSELPPQREGGVHEFFFFACLKYEVNVLVL